jgi:hypothetical protein
MKAMRRMAEMIIGIQMIFDQERPKRKRHKDVVYKYSAVMNKTWKEDTYEYNST